MVNDIEILEKLNIEIGRQESAGDDAAQAWLQGRLAHKLAFRRADLKTFDDRADFIRKIAPGDPRDTAVQSIDVIGSGAFVNCIVTVKTAAGPKQYRNLRLFVRDAGDWKLLGWANEPI
jgi:hypothetical protein